MPILEDDEMTKGMRKTLKAIQLKEDSNGVQRAKAEQKDLERDNNLRKGSGHGFRGDSAAEAASTKESLRGTKGGAGQRAVADLVGGRAAADMRRTASRQDMVDKRKAKANPPGTRGNLAERMKPR